MTLPNGAAAIVEIEKIRGYCLSLVHPRGRHKARVFLAVLGLTAADSEALRSVLIEVAFNGNAVVGASDKYGVRYIIDFEMKWGEKAAVIRSCWIIRAGETAPRFVTCWIL